MLTISGTLGHVREADTGQRTCRGVAGSSFAGEGVPPSIDAGVTVTGDEAMFPSLVNSCSPCHFSGVLLQPSAHSLAAAAAAGWYRLAEHSDSLSGYTLQPLSARTARMLVVR